MLPEPVGHVFSFGIEYMPSCPVEQAVVDVVAFDQSAGACVGFENDDFMFLFQYMCDGKSGYAGADNSDFHVRTI